jgi:hypothetical protein
MIDAYTPGAKHLTVYLDGVEQKYCFAIDEETNEAIIAVLREDGKPLTNYSPEYEATGYAVTRRVGGNVEVDDNGTGVLDKLGWKGGRWKKAV